MDCKTCKNRLQELCSRCFERASKYEPRPIAEKKPEPRVYSIIPTTEKENIRRMYWDEQLALSAIAKEYGVATFTIKRFIKANFTITGRTRKNSNSDFNVEQAKELYESGLSTQKVATELGKTQGAIYAALIDIGVTMRHANGCKKHEAL